MCSRLESTSESELLLAAISLIFALALARADRGRRRLPTGDPGGGGRGVPRVMTGREEVGEEKGVDRFDGTEDRGEDGYEDVAGDGDGDRSKIGSTRSKDVGGWVKTVGVLSSGAATGSSGPHRAPSVGDEEGSG